MRVGGSSGRGSEVVGVELGLVSRGRVGILDHLRRGLKENGLRGRGLVVTALPLRLRIVRRDLHEPEPARERGDERVEPIRLRRPHAVDEEHMKRAFAAPSR